MSTYLYQPGSALEVPGVEATLEYGDASSYVNGGIPGALRLNDRSMPDQVRVTELSGLHDDPDVGDSRTERAGQWGERAGLLIPRGKTVGVTGHVRAGNVPRMRDLWRRTRAQFGRVERDLIIHPPNEALHYINEVASGSTLNWVGVDNTFTLSFTLGSLTAFTDGTLTGVELSGSATSGAASFSIEHTAIPWSGEDLWMTAIVRAPGGAASNISLGARFFDAAGSVVFTWAPTGTGVITSPAIGSYYLLVSRMPALTTKIPNAVSVTPRITAAVPSTGSYSLRAARVSAVKLMASDVAPAGHVSATLPGFEWEGAPNQSRSYGPCYAVNQVSNPDSSTTTWANDSTSGATVDVAGGVVSSWPGDGHKSNSWAIHNPTTTSRTLAIRTLSTALFVVAAGRSYRAHVRLRVDEAFVAGALQVVWLDQSGATISTATVGLFDPVAAGGLVHDVDVDGVVVAPGMASRAYMRIASTTPSTVTDQKLTILVAEPRFVDVSEHDVGSDDVSSAQDPEHGLTTYTPSRSGAALVLAANGARRRITRPFLLRGVRSLWDGKGPESQRNLLYRRDFTMSLRASDPRIYVLDERHSVLRISGTSSLIAYPTTTFRQALDAYTLAVAASDSFEATTAGAALNGRTAPIGGTWATSGDATDFVFSDNMVGSDGVESLARTVSVAETTGRFAILGSTNYTNSQIDVRARFVLSNTEQAAILRWVDASNFLRLKYNSATGVVTLEQVVAGVATTLATPSPGALNTFTALTYRLRLIAFSSGFVVAQVFSDDGSTLYSSAQASSTALATGGALATGKPGIGTRSTSTAGGTHHWDEIVVSTPSLDRTLAPTGFTYDGASIAPEVRWRSTSLGVPFPRDGVTLGWDESYPPISGYLTADSLARMYYSAGALTYTTPQVTVVGNCINGEGFDYDLFADSLVGGAYQYNYIGAMLKRVSAGTWIEARFNSANAASMNAVHGGSPAAPFTLELWSSHNAAGSASVTRVGAWDVPVANIIDGRIKHLRAYMDNSGVVYVELWDQDPNLVDAGLIARHSYALPTALGTLYGPSVAGRAGAMVRLARWDDGTHAGISVSRMQANYDTPYVSSFESIDYTTAFLLINCPVIGDADDVPLQLQLRGDLDTPTLTKISVDTGETSALRLSGKFLESDPVTIDMDAGTIRSDSGLDYFDRRLTGSRFFSLTPGTNIIAVQAVGWDTAAQSHVIATWRDALK